MVDSQTLISSWVWKRDKSCDERRTAKMGKSSSWHTVSQKSGANVDFPGAVEVPKYPNDEAPEKVSYEEMRQYQKRTEHLFF